MERSGDCDAEARAAAPGPAGRARAKGTYRFRLGPACPRDTPHATRASRPLNIHEHGARTAQANDASQRIRKFVTISSLPEIPCPAHESRADLETCESTKVRSARSRASRVRHLVAPALFAITVRISTRSGPAGRRSHVCASAASRSGVSRAAGPAHCCPRGADPATRPRAGSSRFVTRARFLLNTAPIPLTSRMRRTGAETLTIAIAMPRSCARSRIANNSPSPDESTKLTPARSNSSRRRSGASRRRSSCGSSLNVAAMSSSPAIASSSD